MPEGLNIAEQVRVLRSSSNREAYRALQSLQETSDVDDAVYVHIDSFIEMMRDSNSYVRTRGLTLIACNAKWDEAGKIDGIIDRVSRTRDRRQAHNRSAVHTIPPEARRSETAFDAAHRFLTQARRHIGIC